MITVVNEQVVKAPEFLDITLSSCQSPLNFATPAARDYMPEENGMGSPEARQEQPLLSVGLVDKHGSAYRVTDPDRLPKAWSWASPALHKLQQELAPTGNRAVDSLKEKLIRVFRQNGGEFIVSEGQSRLSTLYPMRADNQHLVEPEGLKSGFRKVAAWLINKGAGQNAPVNAEFLALYPHRGGPIYRIDVRAPFYMNNELMTRTGPASNASETAEDHIVFNNIIMHELTHAAVEAGNLLSGRDTTSRTSSNLDSKNRIVNTYLFQLLYVLEPTFFASSVAKLVDTFPYQQNEKLEETLAFAVANYCGDGRQTLSPLLDRFIAEIFSRDLDLILAGDREARRTFLDSLNSSDQEVLAQDCLRKEYEKAQNRNQATAQSQRSPLPRLYQPV